MDNLKKAFNENKKKIIALILALLLGAVGFQMTQEQQDAVVDGITKVVPDLPVEAPPVTEPAQ